MRICIDPGHGGHDPGAVSGGLLEKNLALDAALRIKHAMATAVPGKHSYVMTRISDIYLTLDERSALARRENCDLFLSVHCNSATNPAARGVEAMVQRGDARSFELARRIIHTWKGLDARVVLRPRIVVERPSGTQGGLSVLRKTYQHMPAILLEIGFISNPHDRRLMVDHDYTLNIGRALARILQP